MGQGARRDLTEPSSFPSRRAGRAEERWPLACFLSYWVSGASSPFPIALTYKYGLIRTAAMLRRYDPPRYRRWLRHPSGDGVLNRRSGNGHFGRRPSPTKLLHFYRARLIGAWSLKNYKEIGLRARPGPNLRPQQRAAMERRGRHRIMPAGVPTAESLLAHRSVMKEPDGVS